ncbi:protein-glutamate methylesterase/protein-glutamine glutaminase [Pirellulaceae bacterium SH449]
MSRRIKVLIVDDSAVMRRLLSESLSIDSEIEIVGWAANGKIALAKIPIARPDVVTLDLEMPVMDGLQTIVEIRKLYDRLPVIMFSSLTERGADATFEALAKGANDYVTKPSQVGSVTEAIHNVQRELLPKVRGLFRANEDSLSGRAGAQAPIDNKRSSNVTSKVSDVRFDVLAIGVSTGGPNALATLLPQLPENFPIPILIVQHMPPVFTKQLADRLNQSCCISVREATDGDLVRPGTALIAPGGQHMFVQREGAVCRVHLDQSPMENFCRPSVDVLFRSIDTVFGPHVLATILTGMGRDGLEGCRGIHQSGGYIIAQDKPSSTVWGMPGAVAEAKLADRILPLDRIADEIIRHAFRHRKHGVLANLRG